MPFSEPSMNPSSPHHHRHWHPSPPVYRTLCPFRPHYLDTPRLFTSITLAWFSSAAMLTISRPSTCISSYSDNSLLPTPTNNPNQSSSCLIFRSSRAKLETSLPLASDTASIKTVKTVKTPESTRRRGREPYKTSLSKSHCEPR